MYADLMGNHKKPRIKSHGDNKVTLWEESGVAIAETIYNASENVTTLTSSVDVMNRSIKGMDDEPAIKYA